MIEWSTLAGVVVGGFISCAGLMIIEHYRIRAQNIIWVREKRADLFITLIGFFESVKLPFVLDGEGSGLVNDVNVDLDEIRDKLNELELFIEGHRGEIYVFVPNEIYKEIMLFRAELYECSQKPQLDFMEFQHSNLFLAIKHGFMISYKLKQELMPHDLEKSRGCSN